MINFSKKNNKYSYPEEVRGYGGGTSLLCFLVLAVLLTGLCGCATNLLAPKPDYVEVSSLDGEHEAAPARMTQEQLREEVERFTFRYIGRIYPIFEAIENQATTAEQRLRVHLWKKQFSYSIVKIANGANPETGLLDMLVLATMVRIESEEHLVPEMFFGNKGQAWLKAVRRSETDIWSIAKEVLDTQQQQTIRELIWDWRRKNPEVKNLVAFRFSDFAAEVGGGESLVDSGGLLPEVSEATQAVDEIRRTAERAMFLAFIAPTLARLEGESFVYDLATQPEFKEYKTILKRLSETSAKLAVISDQLPGWVAAERRAAIDHAMDRFVDERDYFFTEIDERSGQLTELLIQTQETLKIGDSLTAHLTSTMTTIDSLVTRLGIGKPDSEKGAFPIVDYRNTLVEAAVTAGEVNKILQSLDRFLDADLGGQTETSANAVLEVLDQHIERWILLEFAALAFLSLFIAIVVVGALLIYRWSLKRIDSRR